MTGAPFELVVPGPPVPKGRPRRGAGGRMYTPPRTRSAEEVVAWHARAAGVTFREPVDVVLVFCEAGARGDLDNLAKLTLDGIVKGELLLDDRQVVALTARRCRVPRGEERTIVRVSEASS